MMVYAKINVNQRRRLTGTTSCNNQMISVGRVATIVLYGRGCQRKISGDLGVFEEFSTFKANIQKT